MNIKSLLLGSAAALVAVSGARAADAVMAEPEAVEYVRVCDAYGAGYFYIPGTETCLKIAGRVRYTAKYHSVTGKKGWIKESNAMLNFTAKNDTDLGTLTSYIEFSATTATTNGTSVAVTGVPITNPSVGGGAFGINHAWISLGGLKMGASDTLYDGGLDGEGSAGGGAGVNFIGYTFTAGAVSATLNLEEETTNVNYVPNIVGKVSFTQGAFGMDLWAAYDDDDNGALPGNSGWSLKGRASVAVGSAGALKILATYNGGGLTNPVGIVHSNMYANGGRWTVGGSYKHTFNPKLALTGLVQYQADTNYEIVGTPNNIIFGGVVDYTIVPQFSAKLAVWHNTNGAAPGTTEGFLRFERSF